MRKLSHDEVAAAAQRRLELLGRELQSAGLTRQEEPTEPAEPAWPAAPADQPEPPGPLPVAVAAPVPPAGRHARSRPPGRWSRLGVAARDAVPPTLQGRTALDGGSLRVVVLLVVVGVLVAGWFAWRSDPGDPVPVSAPAPGGVTSAAPLVAVPSSPGASAAPLGAAGPAAGAATASAGPPESGGVVTVHVAGKVRRPGVVELATGSRVVDALDVAGGARSGVDLAGLNLARVLVDGEQLLVGQPPSAAAAPVAGASVAGTPPQGSGGLVSLNTATLDLLDTLPGVGPVTAEKILTWRETNGSFSAVEELLEIDGIGDKTLAEIAPHVTL